MEWTGDHSCFLLMSSMKKEFDKQKVFDIEQLDLEAMEQRYSSESADPLQNNQTMFKEHIKTNNATVGVMCADPVKVRALMLGAAREGATRSGQFVLFNMDLFAQARLKYQITHTNDKIHSFHYSETKFERQTGGQPAVPAVGSGWRQRRGEQRGALCVRGGTDSDGQHEPQQSGVPIPRQEDQTARNPALRIRAPGRAQHPCGEVLRCCPSLLQRYKFRDRPMY